MLLKWRIHAAIFWSKTKNINIPDHVVISETLPLPLVVIHGHFMNPLSPLIWPRGIWMPPGNLHTRVLANAIADLQFRGKSIFKGRSVNTGPWSPIHVKGFAIGILSAGLIFYIMGSRLMSPLVSNQSSERLDNSMATHPGGDHKNSAQAVSPLFDHWVICLSPD